MVFTGGIVEGVPGCGRCYPAGCRSHTVRWLASPTGECPGIEYHPRPHGNPPRVGIVTALQSVALLPLGEGRVATPPAGSAFAPLRFYRAGPGGECIGSTGAEEAGLLVLGGTFDVQAQGN